MQLKVGELARSSGLTVRTLHHYDEIGLLKPSGRSESGYRLYSQDDVARLHGIQALRHLGLTLSDIGALLDGQAAAPAMIIEQQMKALEREIAHATELRDRLSLISDNIAEGGKPEMGDWLQALALMATYGKYFSAGELKAIFSNWHRIEKDWPLLLVEVRALMDSGVPPESAKAQYMARRWMALVHYWMGGNFDLMKRWGDMYRDEPSAHGHRGGPPADMLAYMDRATEIRMELLKRHFTMDELSRIRYVPECEWRAVDSEARALMNDGKAAHSAEARALLARWLGLLDQLVGGDTQMRTKLMAINRQEPLLAASAPIGPDVRQFFMKALDPHAT